MNPPSSYAQWCDCLDLLTTEQSDDELRSAIPQGKLEWTSGVAERISERFFNSYLLRLKLATARLQRNLDMDFDEPSIVRALLGLRRTLGFLYEITQAQPIPPQLRETLEKIISESADRIQKSMEDSVHLDRSGKLAATIRQNSILTYKDCPPVCTFPRTNAESTSLPQSNPTRRRLLLP